LQRYITAIRDGGIELICDPKRGFTIDKGQLPFEIHLTLQEALGLLMCRASTAGAGRQPFEHSTQSAFEKIAGVLPERVRDLIESDSIQHVGGSRRDYAGVPWGVLMKGCRERKVLEIDYYTISRDERSRRQVDPYCIVWFTGGFCHLIAYCHTRKSVLNFSLDLIERAVDTGVGFEPLPGFSLGAYLKNAGPNAGEPTQIEVVFNTIVARYAKRRVWDFEHMLTPLPDGSLRMTATVRGLTDIKRELLAWGRHAKVIEPPELRHLMAEEARAMVVVYEGSRG
jgi:predicted DNA-binding transcriptional regulator YafY